MEIKDYYNKNEIWLFMKIETKRRNASDEKFKSVLSNCIFYDFILNFQIKLEIIINIG